MSTRGCTWEDTDRDDGSNEHINILDKFRISVNYWEVMGLLRMEPIWRKYVTGRIQGTCVLSWPSLVGSSLFPKCHNEKPLPSWLTPLKARIIGNFPLRSLYHILHDSNTKFLKNRLFWKNKPGLSLSVVVILPFSLSLFYIFMAQNVQPSLTLEGLH